MSLHVLLRFASLGKKNILNNVCNKFNIINKIFNLRNASNSTQSIKTRSTLYYLAAAGVLTVGLSYAAVPLYRMFCQAYSYGGTTAIGHDTSKIETMSVVKHKPIKIRFNADISSSMRWNFKPQQTEITVRKETEMISV